MTKSTSSAITTDIPMQFRLRGGKAIMVMPDGQRAIERQDATVDNTMVKAIARAFRWQRMLSESTYSTMDDLAIGEKINPSYVSRILRLVLLAPDIVEAILAGKHPAHLTMRELMEPFPVEWAAQRDLLCGTAKLTG